MKKQLRYISYTGIIYLIAYIPEYIYYLVYKNQTINENFTIILFITYIVSIISITIFFYGFIILGRKFNNNYLIIGPLIVIIASIFYYLLEICVLFFPEIKSNIIDSSFLVIFGLSGFVFGIGLINIRNIFKYLAFIAGIIELAIGLFFITIIFYIPGYILLIPAGILEILLLLKASELNQLADKSSI
jgi:hypothetical protein